MKKYIVGLVGIGLISQSFAFIWTPRHEDTLLMLVAHTNYMYERGVKPTDDPDPILQAMRLCIVDQMKEPGCKILLGKLQSNMK